MRGGHRLVRAYEVAESADSRLKWTPPVTEMRRYQVAVRVPSLRGPLSYWLIVGPDAARWPAVQVFADWVQPQAAFTRDALAGV